MVDNIIYYFSGTGNSLDIARHIAEQLGDTTIISMKENPQEMHMRSRKRVGFVYPVYYRGMPFLVERFIKTIRMTDNIYVFAIVTGKYKPGNAIKQIQKIFKSTDYHLSYGNFVKTANSNIVESGKQEDVKKCIASTYAYLKPIIEDVIECRINEQSLLNPVTSAFHQLHMEAALKWVEQFQVTLSCNHCGICYQICPTHNIELIDGRPIFRDHCEACMACIQFCPVKAINYKNLTSKRVRYHHPNIQPQDLF